MEKSTKQQRRARRLDAIEQRLAQLQAPDAKGIELVQHYRPDLIPAVILASCDVDHLVGLLGYKPVMRALTKLMRQTLRRIFIARKAQAQLPPVPRLRKRHSVTKPALRAEDPDTDDLVLPPVDELHDLVGADARPHHI
jgi:hypothetical protein